MFQQSMEKKDIDMNLQSDSKILFINVDGGKPQWGISFHIDKNKLPVLLDRQIIPLPFIVYRYTAPEVKRCPRCYSLSHFNVSDCDIKKDNPICLGCCSIGHIMKNCPFRYHPDRELKSTDSIDILNANPKWV